ncbi:MAG TPA: hypothetical protein VJI96_01980 [Candidatus Andersenbacteria bacterium]|nr:hypothetical protein [Candidatus Andersenbacteria bacterium]
MNKNFLAGGVMVIFAGLATASVVFASSDTYKFVVRGNVTEVDKGNNTVTVYTKHASAKAKDDLAGNTTEFNATGVKVYKWVKGKKVRVTLGGVPVGNEVVMEGAKRSEGRFNVSKITVNDNAFSAVGIIRGQSTSNKTLTVDVSYTDYKPTTFKDKRIIFSYGDNTKFYTKAGVEMNADEVANNDEQVKITGTVTSGSKWEALKVTDNYPKAK